MEQRDYILREIVKIGTVINAFRHKIFGRSGNVAITFDNQIANSKGMLSEEMNFDLDMFLDLNTEALNEYILGFDGFNIENIELFADTLSQIGFDDNCGNPRLYLEKAVQLYELCNLKSKTFSFEREAKIKAINNKICSTVMLVDFNNAFASNATCS